MNNAQNNIVVRIETLGCRLNQTESEGLAFVFAKECFSVFSPKSLQNKEQHPALSFADVSLCIVNTCTVTSKAEQKGRRLIRYLLNTHKSSIVLVTGCYAQLEEEKIEKIDERVVVFSGKKKDVLTLLPQYISTHLLKIKKDNIRTEIMKQVIVMFKNEYKDVEFIQVHKHKRSTLKKFDIAQNDLVETTKEDNNQFQYNSVFVPLFALSSPTFMFHSRATLKVEDGCDNTCSFCRIRLARGAAISLPLNEAIRRIKEIEDKGAAEVVITGVNLSQYKSDGHGFAYLLKELLQATSNIRIRISSLYPESITKEFLDVILDDRICPHFHLSIQSGADKILQKMGRRYKRFDIYSAVDKIRMSKQNPFIGCDIITGFPKEDEDNFLQTYSMCKELKFAGIHAFPFSPRPGTAAFNMKDRVSERIARKRVEMLTQLAKNNYQEYLSLCEGNIFFAVSEISCNKQIFVTTENYLHLPLKSKHNHKAGEALMVKLLKNVAIEI